MAKTLTRLLSAAALISLAACHRGGSGSAPSGQVVAKIGGDEITQRELNAELNGFSSQDENTTKKAQQAALNAIANRKLFADAARDAGVENNADYQLLRHRADELMLAQAYEQSLVSKLPRPTTQEVDQYISQHPNSFAQRKIFIVDQFQIPRNTDPQVLEKIKPLHSMDQIEQVLLSSGVDYIRAPSSIDARSAPPALIEQIMRLPPSEPFVLPTNNSLVIDQVKETRTVPFTGNAASDLAQKEILAERGSKAVQARLTELRNKAGQIQYQSGYGPPKAQPKPAPGGQAQKH